MARKPSKRDWKAAYQRRQARARAAGYGSYYEQRIRRGGPPSAPRPSGERLRRARGHASGADLRREARDGMLITAQLGGRDAAGRYHRVDVTMIDGGEHEYLLRGHQLDRKYLQRLVDDLDRRGVVFSPAPSLDLRQIADTASEEAE